MIGGKNYQVFFTVRKLVNLKLSSNNRRRCVGSINTSVRQTRQLAETGLRFNTVSHPREEEEYRP